MQPRQTSVACDLLEFLAGVPLPEWSAASDGMRTQTFKPGEFVFRAGDLAPTVYFVESGLVKLVYETSAGDEWIKGFSYENTFFASIAALQSGGRATFSVVAIEQTTLDQLDYATMLKLAERHIAWQRALRRGFELFGLKKERREHDLLTLSATERYAKFMSDYATLAHRIPQHELAKYLGVTPVALSRIKNRLRRSKDG